MLVGQNRRGQAGSTKEWLWRWLYHPVTLLFHCRESEQQHKHVSNTEIETTRRWPCHLRNDACPSLAWSWTVKIDPSNFQRPPASRNVSPQSQRRCDWRNHGHVDTRVARRIDRMRSRPCCNVNLYLRCSLTFPAPVHGQAMVSTPYPQQQWSQR
jgi:hypothetical protein